MSERPEMKARYPGDRALGDGSRGFTRGTSGLRVTQLRVGDLLISDEPRFDCTNVVEIVSLSRWPHDRNDICYGRFWGRHYNPEFAIWHWELDGICGNRYSQALRSGKPVNVLDDAAELRADALQLAQLESKAKFTEAKHQKLIFFSNELFA